ncbi:MAG: diguanylate cyclase [Rhodocyclaceae bacterium]|nr:diguanylate cyclase [Rhodocyclaceae bacterium]
MAPETSAEEVARLAEKLRLLFETFHAKDLPKFTVSFGVAEFAKGDNLEALFAKADQALYLAKDTGRNRVETFTRTDAKSGPRPSSRNIRVVSDRSRA